MQLPHPLLRPVSTERDTAVAALGASISMDWWPFSDIAPKLMCGSSSELGWSQHVFEYHPYCLYLPDTETSFSVFSFFQALDAAVACSFRFQLSEHESEFGGVHDCCELLVQHTRMFVPQAAAAASRHPRHSAPKHAHQASIISTATAVQVVHGEI